MGAWFLLAPISCFMNQKHKSKKTFSLRGVDYGAINVKEGKDVEIKQQDRRTTSMSTKAMPVVFGIGVIVAAFFVGIFAPQSLLSFSLSSVSPLLPLLISLVAYLALSGVVGILLERHVLFWIHLFSVCALLVGAGDYFVNGFGVVLLGGVLVWMLLGTQEIQHKKEALLQINWWSVTSRGMGMYLSSVAVFFVFVYLNVFGVYQERVVVPEAYVKSVLESSDVVVQKFFPGFSWSMDFNSFLILGAEQKLSAYMENSKVPPLSSGEQKRLVREIVSESRIFWGELAGFEMDMEESLYSIVLRVINGRLFPPVFKETVWFLVLVSVFVFMVMRGLGVIPGLVASLLGYLLLELLVIIGVVVIRFEPRSKEILSFS